MNESGLRISRLTAEHIKEINEAIEKNMRKALEDMNISEEVKIMMDRKYVLDTAKKIVLGGRDEEYGVPEDSFKTIAKFWSAYRGEFYSTADVALMLALLKVARLKTNPAHRDSWIDLAGYAACGGECAQIAVDG